MRPNRVQPAVCQRILTEALGQTTALHILHTAHIDELPMLLPSGPRDLPKLSHELQPFTDLYRALQAHVEQTVALQMIRRCIVDSGLVSHASDTDSNLQSPNSSEITEVQSPQPLNLTSPPPEGFSMPPDELQRGFELAMQHFSCEGQLIEYSPQRVQFHITGCNWCKAMQDTGTPELIPFICETDERFMDDHPTHRLRRPTAIGLGDTHCDFQFVPIGEIRDLDYE